MCVQVHVCVHMSVQYSNVCVYVRVCVSVCGYKYSNKCVYVKYLVE